MNSEEWCQIVEMANVLSDKDTRLQWMKTSDADFFEAAIRKRDQARLKLSNAAKKEKNRCETCSGHGWVVCPHCGGEKGLEIAPGKFAIGCAHCGAKKVRRAGGRKLLELDVTQVTCPECKGSGRKVGCLMIADAMPNQCVSVFH
eukprot:COSAG05_NODE_4876_length_1338_cov_15.110647_2_plen_145_part_00